MNKKAVRKQMRKKRAALSAEEIQHKSNLICKTLSQLPEFQAAKSIAFYVSTKEEVQTHALIKSLLNSKEKRVAVPIYSSTVFSEINDWNELSQGSFGILEPKNVSVIDVDLVVVPGIAFDRNGNRLGHGHGFYDRILAHFSKKAIALAYEDQILENVPIVNHDMKVDKIITEKRTIDCQP